MRVEGVEVRRGHRRSVQHFHEMFDRGRVRHQPVPVVAQRNHRQLEVDPARIACRQLMDLRHLNIADREERDVLVRGRQELFDPLHRLGMEEEIGPLHVFVAAETPELHRIGRNLVDVVEDEFPVFVGRLGRIERFAVGMVDLVAELALHRASLAEADRDLAPVHLAAEDFTIIFILEDKRGLKNWQCSGH